MKNRIINHYVTTIIGLVIIAGTMLLVWFGKTTFVEAGGLVTLASTLILSKDTLFRDVPNDEQ